MSLLIEIPPSFPAERHYTISVLINEFLGLEFDVIEADRHDLRITAGDNRELLLADDFFSLPGDAWLKKSSLPLQPLKIWAISATDIAAKTVSHKIPVIYGEDPVKPGFFDRSENRVKLGLDIFGSSFFMLTRYEEMANPTIDLHGRFSGSAALAFREGFLSRPIVNEYVEILWAIIKDLWPGIVRKKREFSITPTHDVDMPFLFSFCSPGEIIRRMRHVPLARRRPLWAMRNFYRALTHGETNKNDPFDTFDWIMSRSEKTNARSAFYFSAGGRTKFDFPYPLDHPAIQNLLHTIAHRGHEVGFHPSYLAGFNQELWNEELACLRAHVNTAEIHGGRHHYLRFQVPVSWRYWNDAGLTYDSTLSYADKAGFRCGTCYEYSVFDLEKREKLILRERPLILMERSVIDDCYMGLSTSEEAFDYMNQLKRNCQIYNGNFVMLWHNSRLVEETEKEMYIALLGPG